MDLEDAPFRCRLFLVSRESGGESVWVVCATPTEASAAAGKYLNAVDGENIVIKPMRGSLLVAPYATESESTISIVRREAN